MLLTEIIKTIHLLLAISLIGLVATSSFFLYRSQQQGIALLQLSNRCDRLLLSLIFIAGLTGSLLVLPRHYTFHTPWINAAFIFLTIAFALLSYASYSKSKNTRNKCIKHNGRIKFYYGYQFMYFIILVILVCITHDAVMKQTMLTFL